ncbi:MAG: tol-pal system YbgF family protein [Chthoniobacteraceae bacterium]
MPTDPAENIHLSPMEIWFMYKTKILLYGGIILALIFVIVGAQIRSYTRLTNSEALYAKAETVADFRAIAEDYAGTPAGGNASLRLGEKLRAEGKYDESIAALRQFVDKYPKHPLAAGGWTSMGVTYEKQGKIDEALAAYTDGITKYPDAYTTPLAMMAQARLNLEKGNKDEARRIYTDVTARFGQTLYAQEAMRALHFIQK